MRILWIPSLFVGLPLWIAAGCPAPDAYTLLMLSAWAFDKALRERDRLPSLDRKE